MKTFVLDYKLRNAFFAGLGLLVLAKSPVFADQPDAVTPPPSATAPATIPSSAATNSAAPATAGAREAQYRDSAVEGRIKALHNQLKINKDQDAQWSAVADVMRDNAARLRAAYQERDTKKSGMSAVDDIRSYQAIIAQHADGLQKLADAFAPLYAAMTPAQQKNADAVFAHKGENKEQKAH